MVEDFRSRMGELRQEMDRLANQGEELEKVVQDQQARLEEMDLLVRQRDGQLGEQQARVEELEQTLRQREEELADLRARLVERDETVTRQEQELQELRLQLGQREATELALRDQLAQAAPAEAPTEVSISGLADRLDMLEEMVRQHGQAMAQVQQLIQDEMAGLHSRLERIEARLAAAPPPVATPERAEPTVTEVQAPAVEAVQLPLEAPVVVEEVVAPVEEVTAPTEEAVIAEAAAAAEDPLHALLFETLSILPDASVVGLASQDGMSVELVARVEGAEDRGLEVELADLTAEATRVASALDAGPLLTLGFQAGEEHCLVSPVGESHFAFLLTPTSSANDFRRAQAVLLQTASQLNDLF